MRRVFSKISPKYRYGCDNRRMTDSQLTRIKEALRTSRKVVFLGGAGVSVASGIPDFRSPNGLYNKKRADGMRYEDLLSSDYFYADPKGFYDFYWAEMVLPDARPNPAHLALAEYERGHDLSILTQNIDGLHTLAGSKKVYELHGSVQRYRCLKCHRHYDLSRLSRSGVPTCPECGGLIKPEVVLYGEGLPQADFELGMEAVAQADVMIVAGTSLRVYPFAAIPGIFRGKLSVLINVEPTPLDGDFDIVLHEDCSRVLPEILGA